MDAETKRRIEETVLEILNNSDMAETTEYKVRRAASERLGIDLSVPDHKLFVRGVVKSFLASQRDADPSAAAEPEPEPEAVQEEAEEVEEEEEEEEEDKKKMKRGPKEYDVDGDLIICRLSTRRKVTIQDFRGKTLVSIREYYQKDGKDMPSNKGISLTAEQWQAFRNAFPAIEDAIKKAKC